MNKVLVLMYHRINDGYNDFRNLSVSSRRFEQQMRYLKHNYNLIRADFDFKSVKEDSIAITFDDGHRDFYFNAYPILEDMKIPVTNFICTAQIDTSKEKWDDELERLLLSDLNYPKKFKLKDDIYGCVWSTENWVERVELYRAIHWLVKFRVSPQKRDEWFRQIRLWAEMDDIGRLDKLPMSSKQIREISRNDNVLIGAHTVNHFSLPSRSYSEQYLEIANSLKQLNKITGRKIEIFSYPFGNCDKETVRALKSNGIKRAFVATGGVCTLNENIYLLPRVSINNWDVNIFSNYLRSLL